MRRNWAAANPNKKKTADKANYKKNKARVLRNAKVWAEKNPELAKANKIKYYEANKALVVARSRKWAEENPARAAANYRMAAARYRAAKLKATPPWLDTKLKTEIKWFYDNCKQGLHVDHVVPLQGKNVCGLHVPWNLRLICAKENCKKGNKLLD